MTDRRWPGLISMFAAVTMISACGSADELTDAEKTLPATDAPSPAENLSGPDDPIEKLLASGTKCFASAEAVAAASARIVADGAVRMAEIREQRRVADETGKLPPYNFDHVAEVSDPDANHCIRVSTFRYEDRFRD